MAEHTQEEIREHFATVLAGHRAARRMSYGAFGDFLGIDHASARNYERGAALVRVDILIRIASRLGVPVTDLLP